MIKTLIYRMLERRHYWRYVSFSEIAELYASRLLRIFGVSMVSIFVAIYLYQNGYGLTFIAFFFTGYYVFRAMTSYPFAYVIARIGPKHATLLSNFLYIPAMLLLVTLPDWGIYAILGFGFFQSISLSLYDMAYNVDFSKIKHDEHAGKEIGYMHMLEQIARGSSPFIGGFIAYWFGPQVTLFVAAAIFLLSALPLFFTAEPVRTHQSITFHGIPWKRIMRPMFAYAAVGYDTIASSLLWSLFVAIAILGTTSNTIYAQLGVLATLTMITGILSAKIFGMIVDRTKGKELLKVSVFANSLTHISRLFVATPLGVVFVNVFNELATTGFTLPFTKGLFALADDLPGYRIAFMSIMNASASVGAAILCAIVGVLSLYFDESIALQITYAITAVVVLGILTHRFPALNPGRFKL
jgi:MFS family permease